MRWPFVFPSARRNVKTPLICNQDVFSLANGVYFMITIKKTPLCNRNSFITDHITKYPVEPIFLFFFNEEIIRSQKTFDISQRKWGYDYISVFNATYMIIVIVLLWQYCHFPCTENFMIQIFEYSRADDNLIIRKETL